MIASLLVGWEIITFWVEDQTTLSLLANTYVLLISFIFFVFFAFRQWQTIRKEKYANIAPLLHQAIHCIRNAETFLIEKTPGDGATKNEYEMYLETAKSIFGNALDQTVSIFRGVSSTHCRACIKLIYPVDGTLYVYAFLRDQNSQEKCVSMDNRRVEENHDPLEKNSSFARLFSPDENSWHYISNNLASDPDFKTTSMTAYRTDYGQRVSTLRWLAALRSNWPLPYRSTMTCVIRQGSFSFLRKRQSEVLGYLCVDSESRGVFIERWDIQILFAVADALFWPLKRYIAAQRAAEQD